MTDQVAPAEARAFLMDFAPDPNAVAAMPDADVTAWHGRVSGGITKHAKPADWLTGADDDTKGYIQNKGFKTPLDVITSYRGLEKLRGVPAERLLTLPEKMDDDKALRPIYERLGAGKSPADYKLPVPDGDKGEFAKKAAEWFHEIGIPVGMATKIAEKWNAHQAETAAAAKGQGEQMLTQQQEKLKTEWGSNYDKNFTVAKGTAKELGLSKEMIDSMEQAMGYDGVFKFLHGVGQKFGEDRFVTGQLGSGGAGPKGVEQAKAELQHVKSDAEFMRKATDPTQPGHSDAKKKLLDLQKAAFPEAA